MVWSSILNLTSGELRVRAPFLMRAARKILASSFKRTHAACFTPSWPASGLGSSMYPCACWYVSPAMLWMMLFVNCASTMVPSGSISHTTENA
jgi:hypothetical protein